MSEMQPKQLKRWLLFVHCCFSGSPPSVHVPNKRQQIFFNNIFAKPVIAQREGVHTCPGRAYFPMMSFLMRRFSPILAISLPTEREKRSRNRCDATMARFFTFRRIYRTCAHRKEPVLMWSL